jgi:hypothetical protein
MTLSTHRMGNSGLQPSSCRSGKIASRVVTLLCGHRKCRARDSHLICVMRLVAYSVENGFDQFHASASREWGPLWITRKCFGCLPSTTSATSKSVC